MSDIKEKCFYSIGIIFVVLILILIGYSSIKEQTMNEIELTIISNQDTLIIDCNYYYYSKEGFQVYRKGKKILEYKPIGEFIKKAKYKSESNTDKKRGWN